VTKEFYALFSETPLHHVQDLTIMNKLRTRIVIHESFLLYFIPKIVTRLEEAEASRFMKNASASGSSKSQMLPSSLPFPASFFKVLSLPQKFNRFHRFRFHILDLRQSGFMKSLIFI